MAQVGLPLTITFASYRLSTAAPGADPRINENEWGNFIHFPNEKFYAFNKIRAQIPGILALLLLS